MKREGDRDREREERVCAFRESLWLSQKCNGRKRRKGERERGREGEKERQMGREGGHRES
jgi:hypothetical protein